MKRKLISITIAIDSEEDFIERSGVTDNTAMDDASHEEVFSAAIHNAFWQGDEWGYEVVGWRVE